MDERMKRIRYVYLVENIQLLRRRKSVICDRMDEPEQH